MALLANKMSGAASQMRIFSQGGDRIQGNFGRSKPIEDVFFQKTTDAFTYMRPRSKASYTRSGASGPGVMQAECENQGMRSSEIKKAQCSTLIGRNFQANPMIDSKYMMVAYTPFSAKKKTRESILSHST